jgi:amino acid transporter
MLIMSENRKKFLLSLLWSMPIMSFLMTANAFAEGKCGNVQTSIINCSQNGSSGVSNSGIWGILLLVINILSVGVGVLAVGGIVYGAILYGTAADSSEQTKKAKEIIRNVVIGILLYVFMYAFLNYLIPGGVFQ